MTKTELKISVKAVEAEIARLYQRASDLRASIKTIETSERLAKLAKCQHDFFKKWERIFGGQGFEDIEFHVCTKCSLTKDVETVNVVLDSSQYR